MKTTIGLVLLGLHLAGWPLLLRAVHRPARPGFLRGQVAVEGAFLVHIALLLAGAALLAAGADLLE